MRDVADHALDGGESVHVSDFVLCHRPWPPADAHELRRSNYAEYLRELLFHNGLKLAVRLFATIREKRAQQDVIVGGAMVEFVAHEGAGDQAAALGARYQEPKSWRQIRQLLLCISQSHCDRACVFDALQ